MELEKIMLPKLLRKAFFYFVIAIIATSLSCSPTEKKELGENGVTLFHDRFDSGSYHEIYQHADEAFRTVSNEDSFVEYLEAVKRKLGSVKKTTQGVWRVDRFITGTFASFQYQTEFSEGNAVEDFVFVIKSDTATLYRYNINSPLLVTK